MTTEHLISPFGESIARTSATPHDLPDFRGIQRSDQFVQLRARLRRFVFPVSGLFLGWYLLYVLLAAYARAFMSVRLFGEINVGMLLGFLQFVSTGAITIWYVRFARKHIDPDAADIRARAEATTE
jgi:uncharacterized membrane protein (DUF485 family)